MPETQYRRTDIDRAQTELKNPDFGDASRKTA
jgi:hypothetical protein